MYYPGSSPAKDIARSLLYMRMGSLLPKKVTDHSLAVVLAGNKALEIPYLQALSWPLQNILLVDRPPVGLLEHSAAVRTYCGELSDVLKGLRDPIGLSHL